MATMLLRLSAPMQAWGDESKYDIRQIREEPSKSGVIGLLAAALGLRRDCGEILSLSEALRLGVRVDAPGRVIRDFHTALPPKYTTKGEVRHKPDGSVMMENAPYVTTRYYLCDACFLVGLESEDTALLNHLAEALQSPCFPLYLGRRSCPPTLPLCLGIRQKPLAEALEQEPWQASDWYQGRQRGSVRLRLILETPKGQPAWHSLRDQPVTFSPIHRQYTYRGVEREQYVCLREEQGQYVIFGDSGHDPMAEL